MRKTKYVPEGWPPPLWDQLNSFAENSPTPELIAFILLVTARSAGEEFFRRWLKDIANFSRNDLLVVLDELDHKAASRLLGQLTGFHLNGHHNKRRSTKRL